MTDEEFNRIKEEEKEHLRQMRALKRAVHMLERQRTVTNALEEMTSRSKAALEANERLIEEIAFDTARQEAKLDVALESTAGAQVEDDEEIAAARARAMVADVRREVESGPSEGRPNQPAQEPAKDAQPSTEPPPLPEKTLGRLR